MVRIGNIEGLLDAVPASTGNNRARTEAKRAAKTDSVEVSTDALKTAAVFKIASTEGTSEVRQDMVDAARKRLEEGTYRMQNVVQLVAARIASYV